MRPHVCPWWGGYFIDNRLRRLLHKPEQILRPYVARGQTIMDFGCGMGLFAIPAAQMVGPTGRVVAVDLQQQMLDVLMHRAEQSGVAGRIAPHRCQPDAIGWPRPIDFAVAFYSAHEVPDQCRWLREMHGLLREAGDLLIAEPIGHVNRNAFEGMVQVAEKTGFRVRERPHVRLSRAVLLTKASKYAE